MYPKNKRAVTQNSLERLIHKFVSKFSAKQIPPTEKTGIAQRLKYLFHKAGKLFVRYPLSFNVSLEALVII
jgi:hypothetical protein